MSPKSLLQQTHYTQDWVKDFYTQAGIWWGADQEPSLHPLRAEILARLCGPEPKRVLERWRRLRRHRRRAR